MPHNWSMGTKPQPYRLPGRVKTAGMVILTIALVVTVFIVDALPTTVVAVIALLAVIAFVAVVISLIKEDSTHARNHR